MSEQNAKVVGFMYAGICPNKVQGPNDDIPVWKARFVPVHEGQEAHAQDEAQAGLSGQFNRSREGFTLSLSQIELRIKMLQGGSNQEGNVKQLETAHTRLQTHIAVQNGSTLSHVGQTYSKHQA